MALDAKIGIGGEGDQLPVRRTMGTMTTQTVHGQVRVSQVLEFRSDRMRGMLLPIVARATQFDDGGLPGKKLIVGRMWIVTNGTGPVLNRFMFALGLLLSPEGIGMAAPADLELRPLKQVISRGGMRRMALQTPFSGSQGPMQAVFRKHLFDHFGMAGLAELIALFFQFERILGTWAFVALVAQPLGDRFVNMIVEHMFPVGSMRIVTGGAVRLGHGIIQVHRGKLPFRGVVTLLAELRRIARQQKFTLSRSVGIVAVETIVAHRRVRIFQPLDLLGDIFVAAETELLPSPDQLVLVFGGVRIVTSRAFAFCHDLMDTGRLLGKDAGVAFYAKFVGLCQQQFSVVRGMGTMAADAISLLNRRMDERQFQLGGKIIVAFQADFAPGTRLQMKFIGPEGGRADNEQGAEDQNEQGDLLHTYSPDKAHLVTS